jgi:hypothetical protein
VAQQKQQKIDRKFDDPKVLKPQGDKPPWKVPLVATLVDTDSGQPVDGEPANVYVSGKKVDTIHSEEGKLSYELPITDYGTYLIELEAFDTTGRRIKFVYPLSIEKPKAEEKPKRKLYLSTLPVRHELQGCYDISVVLQDENSDSVLEDVDVYLRDPRESAPKPQKTAKGVALFTNIPLPDEHMYVEVFGAGCSNRVSLYPDDSAAFAAQPLQLTPVVPLPLVFPAPPAPTPQPSGPLAHAIAKIPSIWKRPVSRNTENFTTLVAALTLIAFIVSWFL